MFITKKEIYNNFLITAVEEKGLDYWFYIENTNKKLFNTRCGPGYKFYIDYYTVNNDKFQNLNHALNSAKKYIDIWIKLDI